MRHCWILEYARFRGFMAAIAFSVCACPTGAAIRVSPEQFLTYAGPVE